MVIVFSKSDNLIDNKLIDTKIEGMIYLAGLYNHAEYLRTILKSGKSQGKGWTQFRKYANQGIELVVAVLVGTWGGHKLDEWLGTNPWLFLVGFCFGAAAGFRNIFKLIATEQGKKKSG